MKKILAIILLVIWLLFIFFNSHNSGVKSQSISDKLIVTAVTTFTDIEVDQKEMNDIVLKYSYLVRKLAHCIEYILLALFVYNIKSSFNISGCYLVCSLIMVLLACLDEFHQLFIVERNASLFDILLDSCVGIFTLFICKIFERKKDEVS